MGVDRFGNSHAPDLTYARGEILRSAEDDFQKPQVAWSIIRDETDFHADHAGTESLRTRRWREPDSNHRSREGDAGALQLNLLHP
jgi:hypothetical protein